MSDKTTRKPWVSNARWVEPDKNAVLPHGGDRYEECYCAWCLAARDPLAIDLELDRLRRVAEAARIQYDCFGAYSGLIDALKDAGYV